MFQAKLDTKKNEPKKWGSNAIMNHQQLMNLKNFQLNSPSTIQINTLQNFPVTENNEYIMQQPTRHGSDKSELNHSLSYNNPETWICNRGSPGEPNIVNFNTKGKFLTDSNNPNSLKLRHKSAQQKPPISRGKYFEQMKRT